MSKITDAIDEHSKCDEAYLIPYEWASFIEQSLGIRKMTEEEIREYQIEQAMESYAHS